MDVLEAIRTRRSIRAYSPRPIPGDILDRMRQALRFAPSAHNWQPWRFVFVSNPKLRQAVARASNEQLFMADAPLIIVGCGLPKKAYAEMGGRRSSVEIDVAIALDHLTLAAASEGLGTCWIGAFDEDKIKELLGVPPDVMIVAMTPLGYPASPDLIATVSEDDRKPPADVFATDRYA